MFKIVLILAICAACGYVYKKGYVTQWVAQAQQDIATKIQEAAPRTRTPPSTTDPQWEERMRQQREKADRVMAEQQARIAADDACARARTNLNELQTGISQGVSVQNVTEGRKAGEQEMFDARAQNRQYIADNCR